MSMYMYKCIYVRMQDVEGDVDLINEGDSDANQAGRSFHTVINIASNLWTYWLREI